MTFIYNSPIKFNIPTLSFQSRNVAFKPEIQPEGLQDDFATNPLREKIGDDEQILKDIKSNPEIKKLLKEYNLPLKPNIEVLKDLKRNHLKTTRLIAAQMYSALPKELKQEVNLSHLQEAAMLHDYGKVLIPNNILNKPGSLTEDEQNIMHLHSELGYNMLKNKGLSKETLSMIKNHHQYDNDIGTQILSVADKYSALTEKRCYKEAFTKSEALEIIRSDVENGLIMPEIYNSLEKSLEITGEICFI